MAGEWGTFEWGMAAWGGDPEVAVGQQGYVTNAKHDTVFLGKSDSGSWPELIDDQSQLETDLSNQTTYANEANSSRTALTSRRTLECYVVMDTTNDSGTLIEHAWGAAGSTQTYRLYIDGSANVVLAQDHANILTLSLPELGSTDKVKIMWSTEPNPLTTGAGDACRSELRVYVDDGGGSDDDEYAVVNHATPTTSASGTLAIGARYDGTDVFDGSFRAVRISEHNHSSTEWAQDWIAVDPVPTLTAETNLQGLVPSKASGFADDGQFHHSVGPVAAAVKQADMRLVSPLVNEVFASPVVWKQDLTPVGHTQVDEWGRFPPGETTGGKSYPWRLLLHYCVRVPVPPTFNKLQARVHVKNWTDGGTIRKLAVRVYSMSRKPVIGGLIWGVPPPPMQFFYNEQDTSTNHGSGDGGERLTFSPFPIARDPRNFTWLALAVEVRDGVTDADARYEIQEWSVEGLRVRVTSGIDDLTWGG